MCAKTYEPHFLIVWADMDTKIIHNTTGADERVAVKEIPYREDAYEEYNNLIQKGVQKIALARLVKKHVEG